MFSSKLFSMCGPKVIKRSLSSVPSHIKLPINSLSRVSPQDVAYVGVDALDVTLSLEPR